MNASSNTKPHSFHTCTSCPVSNRKCLSYSYGLAFCRNSGTGGSSRCTCRLLYQIHSAQFSALPPLYLKIQIFKFSRAVECPLTGQVFSSC